MAFTYFRRLQDEGQKFYQGLSSRQKWLFGGLGLLLLGLLVTVAIWLQTPNWQTLYTGLSSKDAAQIVSYLKESNVAYQLQNSPDGTTVQVPARQVHDLRLDLAAQDVPREGGVMGFELFDQDNQMGMTNRVFDLNYQRALSGELARTIMELDAVEKARVHLAIPPKQIFSQLQDPPTASVTLKLTPRGNLSETQIKGISKLVAGSVPGLEQKNVTIADSSGNLLFDAEMADGADNLAQLNRQQLELQTTIEKEIRQKVERIIGRVVGVGHVNAQVRAQLDFDREESVSKTYQPNDNPNDPKNTRVLRSEKQVTETGKGTEAVPGGPPGVTPNTTPRYPEQGTAADAEYTRNDTTRNFEVPETQTTRIKDPGQVKRLTLSVAIDSQSPAIDAPEGLDSDDPMLQNLRNLAMTAAGLDPQRGDTIAIYAMPFEHSELEQQQKAMAQAEQWDYWLRAVVIGLSVLAVLVFLFFLIRALSRRQPYEPADEMAQEKMFPTPDDYPVLEAAHSPEYTEAAARRAQAVRGLTEIAREDPAYVARLLRVWIQDN